MRPWRPESLVALTAARRWTAGALAAIVPLSLMVFGLSATAQPVRAVQVQAAWKVTDSGPLNCATCNEFPLTLGLWVPGGDVASGTRAVVPPGASVEIHVVFYSRVPGVITLRKPVRLRVQIGRNNSVIWEGVLPPLAGAIPPGAANLRFQWDQRDSSGHRVPRGTYRVGVVHPVVIAYTMGGAFGEERIMGSIMREFDFANVEVR